MTGTRDIECEPLSREEFAPFGDVIECKSSPDKLINAGRCGRHHDLARLDFGPNGRAGISIFDSESCSLPFIVDLLERHPEGSQAFIPMTLTRFLVVVSETQYARPRAFLTELGQGINFMRGTWHAVLSPLSEPGLFLVVDRIGNTPNLEEYHLPNPWRVVPNAVTTNC
ncbi:MAG: ureidoglycolate lyase [Aestuariivita sp.]|nr:ureidoglycolate lyase [Aestuariivita sp.]MCY4203035.1 ureidoglycolate lyase [Aestuariivita sp.]